MAKLYFKYGTMSAGKSFELLKTADTYERKGRAVTTLVPSTDDRNGVGKVSSRVGLSRDAEVIEDKRGSFEIVRQKCLDHHFVGIGERPSIVLVDEAQFLTRVEVEDLAKIVDRLDIPVICFGLKNQFNNELFEGSAALLAHADDIAEIKAVCSKCESKATMNLRYVNGTPTTTGDAIQVGDEEYESVCRFCFMEAVEDAR